MYSQEKGSKPTELVPVIQCQYMFLVSTTNGHGVINPYPYMSPPFIRTWNNPVGMGVKKKRRGQGLLLGKNSPFNSIPILGTIL